MNAPAPPPEWASPEIGRDRLVRAAVDFVHGFARWNTGATLTYSEPVPVARCTADLRAWLRYVARALVRAHVAVAYVLGPQPGGALHFHVLLAVPGVPPAGFIPALATAWKYVNPRAGFTRIVRLRSPRAAVRYAVAHHASWYVDVACPRRPRCRRRGRCREAPGPWMT